MSVVDGAAHTKKDDVDSSEDSLKNVAEILVLVHNGVQLILGSRKLTELDLDGWKVYAEIWQGLEVIAVWDWWLCWWPAVISRCSLSLSVLIAQCFCKGSTPLLVVCCFFDLAKLGLAAGGKPAVF